MVGSNVSLKYVLEAALGYKNAKDRLQVAIQACVYQVLKGNPDWLTRMFSTAELSQVKHGAVVINADGKAIHRYLMMECGLSDVLAWDKETRKYKMAEGWKLFEDSIDLALLEATLTNIRWDQSTPVKEASEYKADKATQRFIKAMFDQEKGNCSSIDEVIRMVRLQHTAMINK